MGVMTDFGNVLKTKSVSVRKIILVKLDLVVMFYYFYCSITTATAYRVMTT